jgi:signal transduction histidine kinase
MVNEKTIILSVLAGSLFIVVIIIFIFVVGINYRKKMIERDSDYQLQLKNKELEMLRKVIETQETERQKIAANLHDEINPLLASMKWSIKKQTQDLEQLGIDHSWMVKQQQTINIVIDNLHTATRDLSPRLLYKFGLTRAINSYLSDIEGLDVVYNHEVDTGIKLKEIVSLNLYRITLELINNIRKYENATELKVYLEISEKQILLSIKHNGAGISNAEFQDLHMNSKGIGLNSVVSRKTLLNAQLDFNNDGISEIVLVVPLLNARED